MNDMQIIIRKQLSNPLERYKKIGIMGALSVVKAMGSAEVTKQIAAGSGSSKTFLDLILP
jgi:Fanconi anemia group D2 protein